MRIATGMLAGVAVIVLAQTAEALPPKVQGKYAVMSFTQCTSAFNAPTANFLKAPVNSGSGPAVKSINPVENGEFDIEVGTLTFPAAAPAAAGQASIVLTSVSGDVLRINNGGSPVTVSTQSLSGPFTIGPTTFTFKPVAAEPVITWRAVYGDIVPATGVVRTIYMVRKEDDFCIHAISATKQTP